VSQFANFNARGTVSGALVKADAWLFPFLDVYLLLGYIYNTTDVNVQVAVPRPGPLPGNRQFNIAMKVVLDGFVGGGGVTVAAGYCQFFVMADVNYTQTEMGFDDRFRALIGSARAAWNGKVGLIPLRLWVGGVYRDTKNTAKSTVDVPDVGVIRFETDKGPKNPWNAVVGISPAFRRHFEFFAENGFGPGDLMFFAGGLTARF
jgi:hypothetical protein